MLINLTLGGLAVFFIVLFLAFLATKIIIKQTVPGSGSDSNLVHIEPGFKGEDWNSSDEDDEQDQDIFDDNLEIKKDIFIIGERNTDCVDGDFTNKSSDMMRGVRKNLQFSKLFKQQYR